MTNKRPRAAKNKGGRRGSNSQDFISQMSDDILIMILSLLPIKDVVVTGSLSKRWQFLWRNLTHLNFDGSEALDRMAKNRRLYFSEQAKYINQVNSVIDSHEHPTVQCFRIRFDLDAHYEIDINEWLQFAVDKKVEILELDLMGIDHKDRGHYERYDFPLQLSERPVRHLFMWLTPKATVIEIPFLKKLFLKGVNVRDETVEQFLKNSPHLETMSIHGSEYLYYVHVGGRGLNLKHFEITNCYEVESINLHDFDLVSFTYKGPAIELRLADLPKFSQLDIGEGLAGLENNVFGQISSCVSHLQVLCFNIQRPKKSLKLDSIPELPNVKKLMLTIGARKDDCLLEFASIAKACPRLETLKIELIWVSPLKRRRKITHVSSHPHEHLNNLEIVGYYGRVSDLELAVYVIHNALALRKIVIDPRCKYWKGSATVRDISGIEEAARSAAIRQLQPIATPGVELVIL